MPAPTAPSSVSRVAAYGDNVVDPLLSGVRWASNTVTYSFAEYGSLFSTGDYGAQSSGREPWHREFAPLSSSDRPYFLQALQKWSSVANINFVQVTDSASNVGDIRAAYTYQFAHDDAAAWAYLPFQSASAGDIWFNARGSAGTDVWRPGSFAYFTVMHELGHALGLSHPFESSSFDPQIDTQALTLMSYSALPGMSTSSSFSFYPTTPMFLDIIALQHMYGARANNAGDTVYAYGDRETYHETIWDTGGIDTIRYDGFRDSVIDLNLASRIGNPVEIYASLEF